MMAQKPALQQLTASNHGPAVVVSALIFVIVALSAVTTRLLTRFKVARRFASDDCLIITSMILSIAQTAALIVACNHGLGRHRDSIGEASFNIYAKAQYASDILLILTLASAKASVAFLIKGLNPPTGTIKACYGVLILIGLWSLSGIFATAFQCQLPRPWDVNGKCINLFAVDVYNAVLNITTDIMLVIIPLILMLNVQVPAKKRWLVIGLFASRLAVVALSIVTIIKRRHAFASSGDLTWDLVIPSILLQAMLAMSVITACLPSIRRFLADLRSGMTGIRISEPLEKTMRNSTSGNDQHTSKSSSPTETVWSKRDSRYSRNSQVRSTITAFDDDFEEPSSKEQFNPGRNVRSKTTIERSDGVRTISNNVILHTIDYEVTYQEASKNLQPLYTTKPKKSHLRFSDRTTRHLPWPIPKDS